MARQSPSDKIKRMNDVTAAWQQLARGRVFYGLTFAQFRKVIQPSHDTRAQIEDLQKRLRIAIRSRDVADAESLRCVHGVVEGVKGDPEHGQNGALYSAMGYVRRGARRKRRRAKK